MSVLDWIRLPGPREQRQYLEAHLEILSTASDQVLSDLMGQHADAKDLTTWLQRDLLLLQVIRERGRTLKAVREGFVNLYGGLVLDLPAWIEDVAQKLDSLARFGPPEQTRNLRLLHLRAVLGLTALTPDDPTVAKEVLAELQFKLANTLIEGPIPYDKIEIFEETIELCTAALLVYTRERYPYQYGLAQVTCANAYERWMAEDRQAHLLQAVVSYKEAVDVLSPAIYPIQWAASHYHLATIYLYLIEGDQGMRQELAITHFMAALQVYTRETFPEEWASIQSDLGNIYQGRFIGSKAENIEQAISYCEAALQVYTREDFPSEWADTYGYLGRAFEFRVAGERRDNLEQAIACYEKFLEIHTYDTAPYRWAKIQQFLGPVYGQRMAGNHGENLEIAIACCRRALKVFTHETSPLDWAINMANLGTTYQRRIAGERRENLEEAIKCYEAALQVYTLQNQPKDWADVQKSLGELHEKLAEEQRYQYAERAIDYYHAALQVYTQTAFPAEWAELQFRLGHAYRKRHPGEWHENVERVLSHFEAALQVLTYETAPVQWAVTLQNLGMAYKQRFMGIRHQNQEKAIACFQAALRVYMRDAFPDNHAELLNNLGALYQERAVGSQRDNQERAIAYYTETLQIHTRENFPHKWAMTQNNLGVLYAIRLTGNREENQERAIEHFQAALQVHTREAFPVDWASTQHNLAFTYAERITGVSEENLEEAIACCHRALEVRTLSAFPGEYSSTQSRLAYLEAQKSAWMKAHEAYTSCRAARDILLALSVGGAGRDTVLDIGRNDVIHHSFALIRLGRLEEAAVTIEQGRARGLAESLALNTANPERIQNKDRRERYLAVRQRFVDAQAALNKVSFSDRSDSEQRVLFIHRTEQCREAKEAFDQLVAEIRAAHDPEDFLSETPDARTILRAAQCGGDGHAIVYLGATSWGGIAVAALSSISKRSVAPHFTFLELPKLTDACLSELIDVKLKDTRSHLVRGFAYAQSNGVFEELCSGWRGNTFSSKAQALHTSCTATNTVSTLDAAVQATIAQSELVPLVEKPLDDLNAAERESLRDTLNRHYLELELHRCMNVLAEIALTPLIEWLKEQGATSLTLIPCGQLAAFPLASVIITGGRTVSETLPTSVALNARSLLANSQQSGTVRTGVYALGNPDQSLPWSEAEAMTLAKLARDTGIPGKVKVQNSARRAWLIEALQCGKVVDASCHSQFHTDAPLESSLILAGRQYVRLEELLSHHIDIRGLRLFILSACQTALLDLQRAPDEVRSLAAGMIQAGAQGVLAALWPVDDQATYLLMVRFAQEWFPAMDKEPPAAALARAQYWLRTMRNRDLRSWYLHSLPIITAVERREAGAGTTEPDPLQQVLAAMSSEQSAAGFDRGNRYEINQAEDMIRQAAAQQEDPDICPYASPIYWAGFQVMGW